MEQTQFIYPTELNLPGVVRASFTTRYGGVSSGEWKGLNLGLHVGDNLDDVIENREIASREMGVTLDQWICAEQVHGNKVTIVTAEEKGHGARSYEQSMPGTDALVTNVSGILLASFAADCVPILFIDPVQRVIAAAHAGWKGTKDQIAKEVVHTMQTHFSCQPENIMAAIGPAIDKCCYEVDQHVLIPFLEEYPLGKEFFEENQNHRWQLTLPEVNQQILRVAGLLPEHIIRAGGCTSCNTNTFFSHRAEKGKTGRHAGLIVLV